MDKKSNIFENLSIPKIFKGLSKHEFTDILKSGRRIVLPPKNIVFQQGDPSENLYLVNQGCLKLTKLNSAGDKMILRYIGSGEIAAAVAVMRDWDYLATAEAVEETDVIQWHKSEFILKMVNYPTLSANVQAMILNRLDEIQNRFLELVNEPVDKRIARSLLRIAQNIGSAVVKGKSEIGFSIKLSRQDIADYSGASLYTVSRILSDWGKRGWIKSGREKISIEDIDSLTKIVRKSK